MHPMNCREYTAVCLFSRTMLACFSPRTPTEDCRIPHRMQEHNHHVFKDVEVLAARCGISACDAIWVVWQPQLLQHVLSHEEGCGCQRTYEPQVSPNRAIKCNDSNEDFGTILKETMHCAAPVPPWARAIAWEGNQNAGLLRLQDGHNEKNDVSGATGDGHAPCKRAAFGLGFGRPQDGRCVWIRGRHAGWPSPCGRPPAGLGFLLIGTWI
jgi:hypothetical protein